MKIRVASRKSLLSIKQVEMVIDRVKTIYPNIEFEIKFYKTRGDIYRDLPPEKIGGKGIFEKEVNKAVLRGEADIAVHSLKDVPTEVSKDLILAAVLPRDSPHDVILSTKYSSLYKMPGGSKIGTSSVRRRAAILYLRRDLNIENLRGNLDTRIRKLKEGLYDAIIVAEAGLDRLGIGSELYKEVLPIDIVTPAPCQGIIGVYVASENKDVIELIKSINDPKTYIEATVERGIVRRVGGGCSVPLGVYADVSSKNINVVATIYARDGSDKITIRESGSVEDVDTIVYKVADRLRTEANHLL